MIALYTRVSTVEQSQHGFSLEEQAERLKSYCEAMGWLDYQLYTDPGYSGANMERPALQKMLRDVKARRVEKVIVYKLDRLSRSQKDALALIEMFCELGCDFISISESFQTNTPLGKATIGILAVFAQLEREQIRERLTMGKIARAKQGKFHGSSTIPIGYDYKDGQLITNQYEKAQVIRVFTEYAAGKNPPAIARGLNEDGYTQKGKKWLPETVRSIIQRRTYLGFIFYRGEWYEGTHEAFIPPELFETVQRIREQKSAEHKEKNRRAGKANTLLGGYLVCAQCGAKYTRNCHFKTVNGERKKVFPKYECMTRAGKTARDRLRGKCSNKIWREDELNEIVLGEIRKLSLEDYNPPAMDESPEAELIAAEIASITAKIDRLVELYADGDIPRATLQDKIHALTDRREKLEESAERIASRKNKKIPREQLCRVVEGFDDIVAGGNLEEIRTVIGSLIDRIELDGENIRFYWRF